MPDPRPFGFFVHHQGRGHVERIKAIVERLDDRPITVFTVAADAFESLGDDRITAVRLDNGIGHPSPTAALHDQVTPEALHCVPLGSAPMTRNVAAFTRFFAEHRPGLFFVDVSAEWAVLARLASVPAVTVRMHGDRADASHLAGYEASVGMVAPYDAALEQPEYPERLRARTFYSGGLCTTRDPVPDRDEARRALGLPLDREIIVTLSGGGGTGAHYASLTMGARARQDALWLALGPLHVEGHETDFPNLKRLGWVDRPMDYLAAADLVIASAGDNTVHEIARAERPFLCIPEWRYYDEQRVKARELARLGAAHVLADGWPASWTQWTDALDATRALGAGRLAALFEPDAARRIAEHLIELDERLWTGPAPSSGPSAEAHGRRLPRELAFLG